MGPHPPNVEKQKSWVDTELERVTGLLGDDWEVWYVPTPFDPVSRYAWSARPTGAAVATCHGQTPDELVEAVLAYAANLDTHLAQAKTELGQTDPTWCGRVGVLTDLITALENMQPGVEAE